MQVCKFDSEKVLHTFSLLQPNLAATCYVKNTTNKIGFGSSGQVFILQCASQALIIYVWVKSGQNKTKTKQNEASGLVGEFIVSMGSRLESQYLESLGTEVSILGCFFANC